MWALHRLVLLLLLLPMVVARRFAIKIKNSEKNI
jgi:hypothetical protein